MIETSTIDNRETGNTIRRNGEPIRLAYIVNTFGMGGLERCVANLVNELDRRRFLPTIICLSSAGSATEWISASDVEVIELKKRAGNDPGVVLKLARTLRDRQIELVHSHNWGTLVETVIARRWAGVPAHIHAEHGIELVDLRVRRWKFKARRAAMRWALNRTDATVVVDESVREKLVERSGVAPDKIAVVPNGISLDRMEGASTRGRAIRASLGLADDTVLLGSVGRLAPVKDLSLAIDTVVALRKRGVPAHLVLVGDGPEHECLLAHVNACDAEEIVHLVGQQQDVAAWYSAMDVYLNTSISEGMNLAIMEAMASGLPSVVVDVGANRAMVSGQQNCGLVTNDRNAGGLADAIETVLSGSGLNREMRDNARSKYQREFSTVAMTERYTTLYSNICEGVGS